MFSKLRFVRGPAVKNVLIMALAALFAPLAATADSLCQPTTLCVVNTRGTLTGTNSGLTLGGSVVTQIGNMQGSDLGTLSFTTAALISGSLSTGGMFAAGGTFEITETSGAPVLFLGSFSSPVNWTVSGLVLVKGKEKCVPDCTYTLSGNLTGTWSNGATYNGATTQLTFTSKNPFSGSIQLEQGNTFVVTPEPASLGLMGTGLVGIALVVKRKTKLEGSSDRSRKIV